MKLIVIVCLAVLLNEANCGPISSVVKSVGNVAAKILNYKSENFGADGYNFEFESDDGTKREEKGEFVNGIWTVIGIVSWFSPDGQMHTTKYKADDKGYQLEERSGLSAGALASLAG